MTEINGTITTYMGISFNPTEPKEEDIYIQDIAQGLSLLNRYCGQSEFPWSVAQHSLAMSYLAPKEHQLACLLHDASEAYMADLPSPVKRQLPEYSDKESSLLKCIGSKYKVDLFHPEVKLADVRILVTEAPELFPVGPKWWLDAKYPAPYAWKIEERPWKEVKEEFLIRFQDLS